MSEPWILAAPIILLLMGVGVLALDRLALRVVRPPRRPPGRTPRDLSLPFEDVTIPGSIPLRGWLMEPAGDGHPAAVILCHGWAANSGVLVELAAAVVAAGHPVLLFDVRGHGRSEDAPHVTVRHFRDDVRAAAAFMGERHPGRRLVLGGHSMGGAASVLAAAGAGGVEVAGLVLIAAPADVLEVTSDFLDGRGLPGRMMVWAFRPFWRLRVREPYGDLVPERRLKEVKAPVLVVQPEIDVRVPEEHARRLARAAGVEPRFVEGTTHTEILEDPRTAELVKDFLAGLV